MRVLVIEDDLALARMINTVLLRAQLTTQIIADGADGLELALTEPFDVIIVDWMLPGQNGLEICRAVRRAGRPSALLMLTARDAVRDRVAGLDSGADDYLVKPFAVEELLARVRALGRRWAGSGENPEELHWRDLTLDRQSHMVRRGDHTLHLTPREWALLEYLLRHPGQALSRLQILEAVWPYDSDVQQTMVDLYISYLRRKLAVPGQPDLITTVREVGYRLERGDT